MPTNYQRGRGAEYLAIKMLTEVGFLCTRAAQSKGLFDVVAVRHDVVLFIQAKLSKQDKGFSEDDNCRSAREVRVPACAKKQLWYFVSGKGLTEIRDLAEPPIDARTKEGRKRKAEAREWAATFKEAVSHARRRKKDG